MFTMIEGIQQVGNSPTNRTQGEAGAESSKNAPQAGNTEELKRQQEPDDARVEPVVRVETSGQDSRLNNRLSIGIDSGADRFVYKAFNVLTREVERQYPPESALKRSAMLKEYLGQIVDKAE
jgi:uncharacterized FlaG/YvyC family protein